MFTNKPSQLQRDVELQAGDDQITSQQIPEDKETTSENKNATNEFHHKKCHSMMTCGLAKRRRWEHSNKMLNPL